MKYNTHYSCIYVVAWARDLYGSYMSNSSDGSQFHGIVIFGMNSNCLFAVAGDNGFGCEADALLLFFISDFICCIYLNVRYQVYICLLVYISTETLSEDGKCSSAVTRLIVHFTCLIRCAT